VPRSYFDHNATTPPAPAVTAALAQATAEVWGNPSSIHHDGQVARKRLEEARHQVCSLLGCDPKSLVFTSGGTESDNLAILGAVRANSRSHRHVITTTVEHPAVLQACARLEQEGIAVTYLAVDSNGLVDPENLRRHIRSQTVLVSIMHANNETGVVQPIAELARIAREAGALFHSDGVQAAGKTSTDMKALGVDLYSISGHKFYAPKGAGALYARGDVALQPLQHGGRHERSRRAGTENVPGAVALGAAAELVLMRLESESARLGGLRDRLEQALVDRIANVTVNGGNAPRVPNTTNLSFSGIDGEALLIGLDLKGFAVSTGAACSSGAVEPSHVLTGMGLSRDQARASIRFSLGHGNTEEQVESLIVAVTECVAHLRRLSPTYAHA
jgi:cysteine desulfurase